MYMNGILNRWFIVTFVVLSSILLRLSIPILEKTQGQGGMKSFAPAQVTRFCNQPTVFDVCRDLADFTGLSDAELRVRLQRKGRFHFEGEHAFWNPLTATDLAWYYATSVDYLFANAVHPAATTTTDASIEYIVQHGLEPVLDYSGGVGNNLLYLAETHGLHVHYFGIGMAEHAFAEFRIRKRSHSHHAQQQQENGPPSSSLLEDRVTFLKPYSAATNWTFDPVNAPLPRDGSLGAILAMDVLEHIPQYHFVVAAMVDSLRVHGVIVERTPFQTTKTIQPLDVDTTNSTTTNAAVKAKAATAVHLSNGGISMQEAMGPRMKYDKEVGVWIKIAE
jgi:hypothetical protein